MSSSIIASLSKRERQLFTIVLELQSADVNAIMERLPEDLSNSTVRTILRILVRKGALVYEKSGRQFIYTPAVPADEAKGSVIDDVVRTFFDNSAYQTVSTLIDQREDELTDDELEQLEALIRSKRSGGRS